MADLSLRELAELTGRAVESLRRLAHRGDLPGAYRLGGRYAITREAADALRHLPKKKRGDA